MTIASSGAARLYRVYVPAGYSNTTPHALLLMVHGTSDHVADMDLPRYEPLADRDGVLIVKPQGVVTTGPTNPPIYAFGYPNPMILLWPPRGLVAPVPGETHVPDYPQSLIGGAATTWEMHDFDPAINLDYRFILDVVADVSSRFNVDRNRIYQFGQSNGALFTGQVGTHHGELYAACVAIAGGDVEGAAAGSSRGVGGITSWPRGLGPQGPSPDLVAAAGGRRTPFLLVHGTADTVVSPTASTQLRANMLGAGWDEADAQIHLMPNGAHVWWTLHEEVWSFLLAHSRY